MLAMILAALSAPASVMAQEPATEAQPIATIEQDLLTALAEGPADFMVEMVAQADLSKAYDIKDWDARGWFVYNTLKATAEQSQAHARDYLDKVGLRYDSYFTGNEIYVWAGDLKAANTLAALPEVAGIRAPRTGYVDPVVSEVSAAPEGPDALAWGIDWVEADLFWANFGIQGEGIIVANIDTGVQWDHPALDQAYKCPSNPTDPACWSDPSNSCGGAVCDNNGHGTHTMGTMVGDDDPSLTWQAGMAPNAQFIMCKGCESSSCSEASLLACGDWIVAPAGDPANRPHIVNNSWGGRTGTCDTWYLAKVQAWRAAGIFPAFSAGNSGSSCSTLGVPGVYQESFASGGFDSSGNTYTSSSRGPAPSSPPTCDPHEPYTKPNIAAPAVSVCSSVPTNGWSCGYSGTSMASPHSAGAVALLWSCNPSLIGQIDQTFEILQNSTDAPPDAGNCGAPPDGEGEYTHGYGYLNVYNAGMLWCGETGILDGHVYEATKGPIAGATVNAGGPTATTDATGYYSMTLLVGTYVVTASHPLYTDMVIADVDVTTGTVTTQDFDLEPKGRLWGYVTDQDSGVPLEATVIADDGTSADTDPATGLYEMYLDEGSYDVSAWATDYASATATVNIVAGLDTQQDFELLAAIAVAPEPIAITLQLGDTGDVGAVMTNNMAVDYPFRFIEAPSSAAKAVGAPPASLYVQEAAEREEKDPTPLWAVPGSASIEGSGGPDPFGYTYKDSLEPDGPQYNFIDISATGTSVALSDDNYGGPFPIGFTFDFYGTPWTDFYVSSNGFMSFGAGSSTLTNQCPLPSTTTPNNVISLLWDDLDPGDTGDLVYYQTFSACPYAGGACLVVQYDDFCHYPGGATCTPAGTWEAILFDNGNVLIQFMDVGGEAGSSSTTGIENGDGTIGLTYACDTAGSLANETAVCMQYPGAPPCGGGDIPWFATSIVSGTVPLGDSLGWTNAFSATPAYGVDQPGEYHGTLIISPDGGNNLPTKNVDILLTVTAPATWGLLEGTVTSDRPGGPLEAGILIEDGMGMTWTLTTDPATGYYSYWLEDGTYDVTASAEGYVSETVQADITAGLTTTEDFELALIAPEIAVDPLAIDVSLDFGDTTVEPLTIYNDGLVDLTWEIKEADEAYSPSAGEDILIVNDGDTSSTSAFSQAAGNLGYTYLVVDTATFLAMSVDDLLEYQAVIFVHYPSTGAEQNQCMAYLDAGGSLLVADNDFGYFEGTSTLYQTYLEATYVSDAGSDGTITGVDIMAGISADISSDPYPDDFTIGPDAVGIFVAPSGNWAGSRIEINGYKAIYFAWDYYYTGGSAVGDPIETEVLEPALGWLAGGDIVWLSEDPITGTIPAMDNTVVDVTFDAGVVPDPGVYMANLKIRHNDPLQGQVVVPVTMTVSPTPDIGKLEGTVTSDRPGGPLEASVLIEDSLGMTWTVTNDPDTGYYYRWLLTGTYTVTASADGYLPDMALVYVPSQGTVVQDFELIREAGQIEVEPLSMQEVLTFGLTAVQYLTISNVGYADLNYQIVEADRGGPIVEGESYPSLTAGGADLTDANPNAVFGGASEIKGPEAWGNGTAMPGSGRYRAGSISDDCNRIFVIGGDTGASGSADTMVYDSTTDAWTTLANKPRAGMSWQPVVIDGLIYVAGGYNGAHNNWLDIYDPATDTWSAGANMPSATTPMAAAIDGILYVFGGNPGPSANVAKYDPATDTWTAGLTPMPTARSYGRAIASGGYAYVVGGAINGPNAFERYDPATDSWTIGPGLPVGRGDMSLFLVGDYLYAEGGISDYAGWAGVTTVERYYLPDFPAGAWETMAAAPDAFGAAAYACASDKMWSIGGQNASATSTTTNRYHDEGLPCQCGAGGEVDWLSEYPTSGAVPSMDEAVVEVTFDAGMVPEPGTYLANLNVNSDDPYNPRVTVQVTLTVLPSADLGQLEGTVIGMGYCDAESYPAAGAMVHIEDGMGGSWDLEADNSGYYSRWFEAGTYTITVSADDHVDGMAVAEVVAGATTTEDFDLRYIESCMDVTPLAFSIELPPDTQSTETLSIINNGAGDLMWEIQETTATMAIKVEMIAAPAVIPAAGDSPFGDAGYHAGLPAATGPSSPDDDVSLILDDGTSENALGLTAGGQFLYLNRFTPDPALFPFTLQELQHYFYTGQGVVVGDVFDAYIYEDTDGDGDPGTGAVYLGSVQDVTAQALDDWSVWPLATPVVLNGPGDVLIAVVNRTTVAPGTYPATMDQTASQGRSWVGAYSAGDPGDPPTLPPDSLWGIVDSFGFPGNWMVRGYGETGTGMVWLDVPWVSEVPTNGVTMADDTFDVDVIFDTTGLTAGECYTASLGLLHDDPGWDNPTMIPLELCVRDCIEVTDVALSVVNTDTIYVDTLVDFEADIMPDTFDPDYNYNISFGDGAMMSGSGAADPLMFSHAYTETGTYTVTVEVWNCAMTVPVVDTVQVTVEPTPVENYYIYLPIVFKND
jgi:hypothetical protein